MLFLYRKMKKEIYFCRAVPFRSILELNSSTTPGILYNLCKRMAFILINNFQLFLEMQQMINY